jgi:ubiquinone/menaquinone biosynthesis C-methylase UbiE
MITLEPIDAYRLLARDYDSSPNPLLSLEQRTMIPLLTSLPTPLDGARVVDAAAGTGRWTSYCQAQGAQTVAADFCLEMLTSAPRPAVLADANQLPLPEGFADVTICAFALGYAPACLPELARVTRKGGAVLVSDVHPEAIRRGWTRSFRHGKDVIGVAHHSYALEDLFAMGLRLDGLAEPRFGGPEREIFARAGKLDCFVEAARHPAIFVARWIKVG